MLLQHQYEEEKLLDNNLTISFKKAGCITCLFLLLICNRLFAQPDIHWLSAAPYKEAVDHCYNLNLSQSRALVKGSSTPEGLYISSLADVLELLITEDQSKFEEYEAAYEKRIDILKKVSPATEPSLFALAELRLQWSFVYLKFGHEFTAAWNIRQAHIITQESKRKFPTSVLINKPSGSLEIILGSVPDKYQWILNLLGMSGSVEVGLKQLKLAENYGGALGFEAALLNHLIDGFILQQTDSAVAGIEKLHVQYPANQLILFLGASLAIKNSMSEVAMNLLEKLKSMNNGLPIHYADYLLGEVYLHQGNYSKSIQSYRSFIRQYKGKNCVKDAHYKVGICYWLDQRSESALTYFDLARTSGRDASEADKYAARALSEISVLNMKLTKARYSTDGGYYNQALRILNSITEKELTSTRQVTEYNYRLARLYHKTNKPEEAKKYYAKTIELAKQENWYFAPNSCLQMGYIHANELNAAEARKYFTQALGYKNHVYKNSIDSKAKSALGQLKKKT